MNIEAPISEHSFRSQAGVTLVELLVAMALSVFLMAAVTQSFLGSRQASDVVQAQARMQESARFAFNFMARSAREAGYATEFLEPDGLPDVTIINPQWRDTNWRRAGVFEAQAIVAGIDGNYAPAKPGSDALFIRVQGQEDGSVMDCHGVPVPTFSFRGRPNSIWLTQTFYIDDDNNFRCTTDQPLVKGGGLRNEVLVPGIEELQLMYGLNAGAVNSDEVVENPQQVVRWVNANNIGAEMWRFVVAVKVAMVSISDTQPLSQEGPSRQYALLDYKSPARDDGRARQRFTQTIRLRNQTWNAKPN